MLEVKELTKIYNNQRGVSKLCFTVKNGEIAAFVGPNGAGKTTLFRILAGVIENYSGRCLLNSTDISVSKTKDKISWIDETPFAFPDMTPVQFAFYIRAMKELSVTDDEINELLSIFELSPYKNRKIKTFSQGMYKKAAVIPILMGTPELLILDEPTNGLDTHSVIILKQLLLKAKGRGAVVLISSHILDFVEKISDKVYFLKNGCLCAEKNSFEVDLEEIYKQLYL